MREKEKKNENKKPINVRRLRPRVERKKRQREREKREQKKGENYLQESTRNATHPRKRLPEFCAKVQPFFSYTLYHN